MSRYVDEPPSEQKPAEKTAILLINLGTPDAPTPAAVRRYLKEFLADPRVIELSKLLWWPVLNGIILNTRPKKSAEKYARIWSKDGSPLKIHTERQCKLLRGLLGQAGHQVCVEYAMRYGQPSIPSILTQLKAEGCSRILLLPLYPQYAASTTATAVDAAAGWLTRQRRQPEWRSLRAYADDPGYIEALATSCPLCEYNLGKQQGRLLAASAIDSALPTYYFTQLLALALGVEEANCHFEMNEAIGVELLRKKTYLAAA